MGNGMLTRLEGLDAEAQSRRGTKSAGHENTNTTARSRRFDCAPSAPQSRHDELISAPLRLCVETRKRHTSARIRAGPPVAPTCLGAPTMTVAPDDGTRLSFAISSTPYLPAPRIATCATTYRA